MVEAAIFDMDGLIADTEPTWCRIMCESFTHTGINLTQKQCWSVQGKGTREAIRYWYDLFPSDNHMPESEMFDLIINNMLAEINRELYVFPGVYDTINWYKAHDIPLALASGSPMSIIEAVIRKAGLEDTFKVIRTAEKLKYSKPNPEIFLLAAEDLGVNRQNCVVFEDSYNGVIAAKAAGMKIVAVPDPYQFDNPYYVLADAKLHSLTEFNPEIFNSL